MLSRRFALTVALLVLVACGSDGDEETAGSIDVPATTTQSASASTPSTAATTASGCGVTLADVQALLAANSGVTQNRTPEAIRCNFTWNDNGPRGIEVARGSRRAGRVEAQSAKLPSRPTTLKDGTAEESLRGLGDRAWAYGNARQANAVVLRGADLYAVDLVIDGTPAGSKSPTGMDSKSLEICQATGQEGAGLTAAGMRRARSTSDRDSCRRTTVDATHPACADPFRPVPGRFPAAG